METRLIETEEEYRATLREIEPLMDAAPGSPEEERLVVLGTRVQKYEAIHYPIPPPSAIEEYIYDLECKGIPRKEAEEYAKKRESNRQSIRPRRKVRKVA